MLEFSILIVSIIIFIILTNQNSRHTMTYLDTLKLNLKLLLINNAGIIIQHPKSIKVMQTLLSDPLLVKRHRDLNKKYGNYVNTYIGSSKNYYILDTKLASQILTDSPYLFSAGKLKENFFKKFMPLNVGISKCSIKTKCPWKKRREYNEKVLGTRAMTLFFKCLTEIIDTHLIKAPLLQKDFEKISYPLISNIIFGSDDKIYSDTLRKFFYLKKDSNFQKNNYFQEYQKLLRKSYKIAPKCSLLHYAKIFNQDTKLVRDDQLPHIFGPFIFIINYLIPNLLCIILNFSDIYQKLMLEIEGNKANYEEYIASKNTYLHHCIIEHIRLFNTININIQRTVGKTMLYHGLDLKKGEQIFILFSSILRDPIKFKDPDFYKPERWKSKSVLEQEIIFGIGPQQCPSKEITPLVYKHIIYKILKKYKLEVVKPQFKSKKLYFINPFDIEFRKKNK